MPGRKWNLKHCDRRDIPCTICGHGLHNPRYMVPGLFGVLIHQCPKRIEASIQGQETAAENLDAEVSRALRRKPYGERLRDGFNLGKGR